MGCCCRKKKLNNNLRNDCKNNLLASLISQHPSDKVISSEISLKRSYSKSVMWKASINQQTKSNQICIEDFELIKLLGKGNFGKVFLGKKNDDNCHYAIKVLKKSTIKQTNQIFHTMTEREILERIDNPFIVKLRFAFQTREKLYLVTDFIQGGELYFHLHQEKNFSEDKTKFYVTEIILALEHLHKNKIIYRDLKPENILIAKDGHIKLTDFGLSKFMYNLETSRAFTICGTPEYLAPEILESNGYNKAVDWWSLGVIFYEMLCGQTPFKCKKKLDPNNYKKTVEIPSFLSEDAKDLLRTLLTYDPDSRIGKGLADSDEIKSHKFFSDVDWEKVYNRTQDPPFIPDLKSPSDYRYFSSNFTSQPIKISITNDYFFSKIDDGNNYEHFSYINSQESSKSPNIIKTRGAE